MNIRKGEVARAVYYDNSISNINANNVKEALDAIHAGDISLVSTQVVATSTVTTSSSTFSTIAGMSVTPAAGTYLVQFSGSLSITTGVNGTGEIAIFQTGTRIPHTNRTMNLTVTLALGLIGTSAISPSGSDTTAIVTVNGTDVIDVRFRSVSGDPFQAVNRSMQLIKIG